MNTRQCGRSVAGVAVAIVTALCLALPAAAETRTVKDDTKDVGSALGKPQEVTYGANGLDILRTRIRYADGALVVRTTFRNLTRCNTEVLEQCSPWIPQQSLALDTRPDRAGALYEEEYSVSYLDHHVNLQGVLGERTCPGLRWRSNLQRETSTFVVPRRCLRPRDRHRVRINLFVSKSGKNYPKAGYADLVSDSLSWTTWVTYD